MAAHQKNRELGALFTSLIAALAVASTATAAEYYLYVAPTSVTVPDDRSSGTESVYMWGFGLTNATFDPVPTTVPGPRLTVSPGDSTLTIHVKNMLPEPISIVIPGQITTMAPVFDPDPDGTGRPRVRSFTHETPANGGTATYNWSSFNAGTYLYQSGTHPTVQVQMGLYGAATKDQATGTAYPGITYDQEHLLIYSEIDPQLHKAVDPSYTLLTYEAFGTPGPSTMTSTIDYRPKYFLINGEAYNDIANNPNLPTTANLSVTASNRVLLRFVNVGLRNLTPNLLGLSMEIVAEDGNTYPYARRQYASLLPPAKTRDAIVTIPAGGGTFPLLERGGSLNNNGGAAPGGMLRYLATSGDSTGDKKSGSEEEASRRPANATRKL